MCWKFIIAEYSDFFEALGMPAERDTVHEIELYPGSVPLYKQQYRVSAAELAEVRRQLDKYLIRLPCPMGPPSSSFGKDWGIGCDS